MFIIPRKSLAGPPPPPNLGGPKGGPGLPPSLKPAGAPPSNNALLGSIQGGFSLKKTQTNGGLSMNHYLNVCIVKIFMHTYICTYISFFL